MGLNVNMAAQTLTLEEWREWSQTHRRNFTDDPIGRTPRGERATGNNTDHRLEPVPNRTGAERKREERRRDRSD